MITIQIPVVYKERTSLIQYPEDDILFKNGVIIDGQVICDYYGELDIYTEYIRPEEQEDIILSKYNFMLLVGVDNMVAIKTAAKTDVQVEVFVLLIENAEEVILSESALIEGLEYLVYTNVITQEESERILQG